MLTRGLIQGLLLALLAVSGNALAAQAAGERSARGWLEQMSYSHRELNYTGVVTYQVGDRLSTFRITHSITDGREYEYLEPLDSNGRELARSGHSLQCVHPADQIIRPGSSPGQAAAIDSYYELAIAGHGRVAGRDSVVIRITPRDAYRLGYRLVLDQQSALPLKVEVLDEQGRVLERFQYAMVEIGAAALQPGPTGDAIEVTHAEPLAIAASQRLLRARPWRPSWVPPGFVLAQVGDNGAGDGLSYTDGLAMFSVFLERRDATQPLPPEAAMRRGASIMYTRPLTERPLTVTVVGEIPPASARAVAGSIAFNPGAH